MNNIDFVQIRKCLGKTQAQLAALLCVSPKAIQSFEQGWRPVPTYIEREMLMLKSLKVSTDRNVKPCWEVTNCPMEWRDDCIVWELKVRHFCWLINGTNCQGKIQKNWQEKIMLCWDCEVFRQLIDKGI